MRNHRKLIKAGRKTWTHMVPAVDVAMLEIAVKRTEITLEVGAVSVKIIRQKRPVTPEAFKRPAGAQSQAEAMVRDRFDKPWEGRKQA